MTFTEKARPIFERAIRDYHQTDDIDAPLQNPYAAGTIEADLYRKCWIDTVQWHLEDIVRDPEINPVAATSTPCTTAYNVCPKPPSTPRVPPGPLTV